MNDSQLPLNRRQDILSRSLTLKLGRRRAAVHHRFSPAHSKWTATGQWPGSQAALMRPNVEGGWLLLIWFKACSLYAHFTSATTRACCTSRHSHFYRLVSQLWQFNMIVKSKNMIFAWLGCKYSQRRNSLFLPSFFWQKWNNISLQLGSVQDVMVQQD